MGVGSIGGGACELWGRGGGLCTVYFLEGGAYKNLWVLGEGSSRKFLKFTASETAGFCDHNFNTM